MQLRDLYSDLVGRELADVRLTLADAVVTALFADEPPSTTQRLADVYRLASLAAGETTGATDTTATIFRRTPLVLTSIPDINPGNPRRVDSTALPTRAERLYATLLELERFDQAAHLTRPPADGSVPKGSKPPFCLSANAVSKLSNDTTNLLSEVGLDPSGQPLAVLISRAEEMFWQSLEKVSLLESGGAAVVRDPVVSPLSLQGEGGDDSFVSMRNVAQHLVVRQHLKAYELLDIAHIQNVLPKESNSRTHRTLDRTERTLLIESEETEERESEHETAERTDINLEAARAAEEESQRRVELSLSGRYGPSVEFSSEMGMETTITESESSSFATSFAKSVTDRTVERVSSRLLTRRFVSTISETEETNTHGLTGPRQRPYRGIYQYVDKVYEAQVFDIGARTVMDLYLPEPGAFLASLRLPDPVQGAAVAPPPRLDDYVGTQADVTELNYLTLCATFGVSDPPPRPHPSATSEYPRPNDSPQRARRASQRKALRGQ
jgi:hypothetical protein